MTEETINYEKLNNDQLFHILTKIDDDIQPLEKVKARITDIIVNRIMEDREKNISVPAKPHPQWRLVRVA